MFSVLADQIPRVENDKCTHRIASHSDHCKDPRRSWLMNSVRAFFFLDGSFNRFVPGGALLKPVA